MPVSVYGQKITFASQLDPDQSYTHYVYARATSGQDTIAQILAARGQPDLVSEVLALNTKIRLKNGSRLRSAYEKLKLGQLVRLPGTLGQIDSFSVLCDDNRPIIKDGYAMYDTVDRPGRVGLNRFLGYNPIQMDIAVQFEGLALQETEVSSTVQITHGKRVNRTRDPHVKYASTGIGADIETNIRKLERMAGRGDYAGAATGPPAVVRVSVTDSRGHVVPLIAPNYQWSPSNPNAPLYRISALAWADGALSDDDGNRVRQACVVSVKQFTPLTNILRSASQRAAGRASS